MRRAEKYLLKIRMRREPDVLLILPGIQIIQWEPIELPNLPIGQMCNLHGQKMHLDGCGV